MLCDHDRSAFSDLLDEVGEAYGQAVSVSVKRTWWRLLADKLDLPTLRAALDRHMLDPERGRYFPRPIDVAAGLERLRSERPSADEAWALAIETFDEAATVCLTDEILIACAAATPVWHTGDRVGARMAFKAAYERVVAERRRQCQAPRWQLSLGWDANHRAAAARMAVETGRLALEQVNHLLPAPAPDEDQTTAAQLTGKVLSLPRDDQTVARQRLRALRELILQRPEAPPDTKPRPAAAQRGREARRKRKALAGLKRLQAERGAS